MAREPSRRSGIEHTPEDRARHRAIREAFRSEPGLRELRDSGEIDQATYERASRLRQSEPPAVDPEILAQLGGTLRRLREASGLSLADITARSGIDAPALSRLENGQNPNPTLATLARYAQALGKRVHWTLEG